MQLSKIGDLANTVAFEPLKFQIQTPIIWAKVDLEIEGIGFSIFGADWTYMDWGISIGKSTHPKETKFYGADLRTQPKVWLKFGKMSLPKHRILDFVTRAKELGFHPPFLSTPKSQLVNYLVNFNVPQNLHAFS